MYYKSLQRRTTQKHNFALIQVAKVFASLVQGSSPYQIVLDAKFPAAWRGWKGF